MQKSENLSWFNDLVKEASKQISGWEEWQRKALGVSTPPAKKAEAGKSRRAAS